MGLVQGYAMAHHRLALVNFLVYSDLVLHCSQKFMFGIGDHKSKVLRLEVTHLP